MNTAARALTENQIDIWRYFHNWRLSLKVVIIFLSIFAVLASALGVVYFKNLERALYSQLQSAQLEQNKLDTQWTELLVEKNTLSNPARIHFLAEKKLGMMTPISKDIIIVSLPTN